MKRSKMVELIAEALLQSLIYGGDEQEREQVRKTSLMNRLRIAHICLEAAENNNMVYVDDNYVRGWEEGEN